MEKIRQGLTLKRLTCGGSAPQPALMRWFYDMFLGVQKADRTRSESEASCGRGRDPCQINATACTAFRLGVEFLQGPVQAYAVVATAQHRDQGWGMTETNPMGSFGIRAARLIQHTVFFLIRSDVLRQENQSLNPNGPPWLVQIFTRE